MGTSHETTAKIRVFPIHKQNRVANMKEALRNMSFGYEDCEDFLQDEIKLSNMTSKAISVKLSSMMFIFVYSLILRYSNLVTVK